MSLGTDIRAGYTTNIEEVDVRVLDSRVLLHRHSTKDTTAQVTSSLHHIICVTLKDGTAWAVDPAGAQHGQKHPVLPFDEYKRDFVAKVLVRRPYGENKLHLEKFTTERHPREEWYESIAVKLGFVLEYVVDELEEWKVKHAKIEDIIKANADDYKRLKATLVTHLATAAREFLKHANGDPTSTAKPVDLNASSQGLSKEERLKKQRKEDRTKAAMDPSMRKLLEDVQAKGGNVFMF